MRKLVRKHEDELLAKENVNLVMEGTKLTGGKNTGRKCIVVGVERKVHLQKLKEKDKIPETLDGVETDVQETNHIKALAVDPTGKFRPAPGGISIGHFLITAGTLGKAVMKDGQLMILSNNHVLANSNNAIIGDSIYQPGPYDNGTAADKIATLYQFIPINFNGGDNIVDCALALPDSQGDLLTEILEIGEVSGTMPPNLGLSIRKFGRTTLQTVGNIIGINATVTVDYGSGKTAKFVDQIVAGPMCSGGDSGSLVVTNTEGQPPTPPPSPPDDGDSCSIASLYAKIGNAIASILGSKWRIKPYSTIQATTDEKAVGLLFAGSDTTTILNPIDEVCTRLGITI